METQKQQELSVGQKLVGIKFNPDNRDDVYLLKSKFAEIIDILAGLESSSATKESLSAVAINHAITAQMWAVKAVTWKE